MNNYDLVNNILSIRGDEKSIMIIVEYGSHVYGTVTEKSDKDLIVIVDSVEELYDVQVIKEHNVDLHLISFRTFEKLLNEHDIMALETWYQLHEDDKSLFKFQLNLDTLRRRISAVVSNSWSKARKKLDIPEEDDYIALKSLFHSLRILSYGIDIAENNKIDYLNVLIDGNKITCSDLWKTINIRYNTGWRWKEFKAVYTPIQNANATKFRLLAPKID